MNFFKSITFLFLVSLSQITFAKDILVSSQTDTNNTRQQFINAYNKAVSGDVIIVDVDVLLKENEAPIVISKNNLTIKGKNKGIGKFKFLRNNQKEFIVKVIGSNITIQNLLFLNGMQQLYFINQKEIVHHINVVDCYFKNGKYTGVNFKGNFKNVNVTNTIFENTKFSLQTMDCSILENFIVDDCKFFKGDHQISLDNPHAEIKSHKNIQIKNTFFGLTSRFNIALANTQNVTIKNCVFEGGTGPYSQALHFEDRTKNVWVKNNKIKCMADVAILLYATDKIGHGTGRRLTEEEKQASGSGNITLDNNVIESGNTDTAISIGYGKGYLKIKANNIITSKSYGIKSFKSATTMRFLIDSKTMIKGKKYGDILKISDKETKESYVRIQ
ncbi:polygalacturonase [Wenyingzhuangia heitensis]|uniref:Polygalacturonase n=1 Tax=Wenyingzhuangia heitensis TaxID=1487859 RepID=A0ABX0UC77_9FLAO|nr:right-handed parallel beta-helix repeat-containing protein [Wenyingzhuangia heitensis]NIJ45500.1 polygalacturonase [Wenyingzhuangia heitensis]